MAGRAKRALSCFVTTLSYSRALYLEFFFDQTMESFLRGHVHAFAFWCGGTGTRRVYRAIRSVSAFVDTDRARDGDIAAVAGLIERREIPVLRN